MKSVLCFVLVVTLSVGAQDTTCGVVPVTQWGGSPLNRQETLPTPVNIVIIQHTATPGCQADDECAQMVAAIRESHIKRGFDDMGPSFLIGGNGKVYEGAGWQYVGAHTRGYNRRAIGVTFIGDFRDSLPSESAQNSLHNLLSCGVENKYLTDAYHLVAHNQLSNTESPGDVLRKQVEQWPHWLDHAKDTLN